MLKETYRRIERGKEVGLHSEKRPHLPLDTALGVKKKLVELESEQ